MATNPPYDMKPQKNTRFKEISYIAQTGSTNDDLMVEAKNLAPEGLVLVTDHQSKGKGRQNRQWYDKPGSSILMSVLLRPRQELAHLMPIVAGVSILETVERLGCSSASLKWPNDVVADQGKLAGILAEAVSNSSETAVVLGMGINLKSLDEPNSIGYIALETLVGGQLSREYVIDMLLESLEKWLSSLEQDKGLNLLDSYRKGCSTIGCTVEVSIAGSLVQGKVVDVTSKGHLLVQKQSDELVEVSYGDAHIMSIDR